MKIIFNLIAFIFLGAIFLGCTKNRLTSVNTDAILVELNVVEFAKVGDEIRFYVRKEEGFSSGFKAHLWFNNARNLHTEDVSFSGTLVNDGVDDQTDGLQGIFVDKTGNSFTITVLEYDIGDAGNLFAAVCSAKHSGWVTGFLQIDFFGVNDMGQPEDIQFKIFIE